MKGILLFGHGARNPAWAAPFEKIRQKLKAADANLLVESGFLEMLSPSFDESIDSLAAQGARHITVVPVFIAGGGHVLKDLPSLVEQAINRHPMLSIRIAHPVGESEAVLDAMARYIMASVNQLLY